MRLAALLAVCCLLLGGGVGFAQPNTVEEVEISASSWTLYDDTEIYLICPTPGAVVRYTLDGADPTETSEIYDPDTPLLAGDIAQAHTAGGFLLKARAYLDTEAGNITEQQFTQVLCAPVTFAPDSGFYTDGTQIGLACTTPGSQIWYTTDGADPFTAGTLYTDAITIADGMEVNAFAKAAGYQDGEIAQAWYGTDGVDAYEPNDTLKEAAPITIPANIRATISNGSDLDYYSFALPQGGRTQLVLTQPQDESFFYKYELRLFDGDWNKIDVVMDSTDVRIVRYLAPGTYYVMVKSGDHSYSKAEYGLSISALESDRYDFSEYNLVNAAFHPDSRFAFDRGRRGDILSPAAAYTSAACLSRWDGYLTEQQDPYVLYYTEDDIVDRSDSFYHTGIAAYRLKDMLLLPQRMDALDNSYYKNAIYTYGALYCGIMEEEEYYRENKTYFYHPPELTDGSGHAVTIVGWDDSIPKEQFAVQVGGEEYVPEYDGAFLAKNSYGETRGKEGYFYISYCSGYFSNNPAAVMKAEPRRQDVNVLYMHDPYGYTGFIDGEAPFGGGEMWAKNVFTASSGQTLKSVSFYALGMEQEYDIWIGINGEEIPAASGVHQHAGYYTVDVREGIRLEKGTEFSVTVRQKNIDGKQVTAALERPAAGYASRATAKAGQSFLRIDGGEWQDISQELSANNCIKVYACDEAAGDDAIVTEETGGDAAGVQADTMQTMSLPEIQNGAFAGEDGAVPAFLPAAFDLRNIGAVTSVKSQGNPPTCWTFATMGSSESVLLKAGSGFDTGISIAAHAQTTGIEAGGNAVAAATVQQPSGNGGKVYWQFSGDLGAVELKNRVSESGQSVVLFAARHKGTVRATAVSAADGTKTADIVFEVREKEEPASSQETGGDGGEEGGKARPKAPLTRDTRSLIPLALLAGNAGLCIALAAGWLQYKRR